MLLRQIICYFAAVMKCSFYISLLLCCILGFTACTGPVLVEEEGKTVQDGQLSVRDSVPIIHEGTCASPYSIGEAQTLGRGREVWIEGYIVGCVSGSMKKGCNFSLGANTASNILLADIFPTGDENDYLYCLPVELPTSSIEREDLNLYDNPDNYHRKVRLQGDVTLYYKVVGMKEVVDYFFCDEMNSDEPNEEDDVDEGKEETNNPEEPNTPHDPDATRKDTLSIAEGIRLQKEDGYEQARIRGYIVGYAKGNNSVAFLDSETTPSAKAKGNVVLADNINERELSKINVVQLPEGFIRDDVNLYTNPKNMHKRLTVMGMMTPYYGLAGCIEVLGAGNRECYLLE